VTNRESGLWTPEALQARAAAAHQQSQELGAVRAALAEEFTALLSDRAALVAQARDHQAALLAAASRFAVLLKQAGAPPERMLVELKAAVPPALASAGDGARELAERVIRWSIEAYYDAPAA
jgi:hypothetical protein